MNTTAELMRTLQQAAALHQNGDISEAQRRYEAILRTWPGHAEALRLHGVTLYQQGRYEQAQTRISQAIAADPRSAVAHASLGLVLQARGFLDEAVASYDMAIHLAPRMASVRNNRGSALLALQRAADALASFDQALAIDPRYAEALNNRGNALRQIERHTEALASYDRALALRPTYAEAHYNRGNLLLDLKRPQEALTSFDQALRLNPQNADVLHNRGNALRELRRPEEALASFDDALARRPGHAETFASRGNALRDLGRHAEALVSYDTALALRPDYAEAFNNRGVVRRDMRQPTAAIADYRQAIAINSGYADAYANLASALLEVGQLQDAHQAIISALALDPANPKYYHHLAEFDGAAVNATTRAAMESLARDAMLPAESRMFLHFALGKACADAGQHDNSFNHYRIGNALRRTRLSYSADAFDGFVERIRAAFGSAQVAVLRGSGNASDVPVFIVGMPRSGSTLVEQVLASHPDVHGGGEVSDFADSVADLRARDPRSTAYPELVADLDDGRLRALAADYLARLGHTSAKARITDKMLDNFLHVGLINLALPNARIIHTQRDPVDTCLSCFSKLFAGDGHPYSYDLAELGRYYRTYVTLMDHWRRVLPLGVMLDVRYEDVVADLEQEARRIVAHCGLAWDPVCLAFHKTQRPVRTLSMTQVRRPIYGDSVGRRRHHGAELRPLLDALGNLGVGELPQADQAAV